MTDDAGDPLRALTDLLARVAQTLRVEDTPATRRQAAAEVDQLRELVAAADRARPAGSAERFDLARVSAALRVFAESLRAPTSANEAEAVQAIAELQAAMGPPADPAQPGDAAAEREHHREQARTAMDDYFRDHPVKPLKP